MSPPGERNEETIQKSQDFGGMQHQCEDHRSNFEAAVKPLNKRKIDRRWRKPRVQFGMKIWFQKIGEEGINSTLKRRTQGMFVGHQDRTRVILYIAKSGRVGCHSWIRPDFE